MFIKRGSLINLTIVMDRIEKRLGKMWRHVKRGKKKDKEEKIEEIKVIDDNKKIRGVKENVELLLKEKTRLEKKRMIAEEEDIDEDEGITNISPRRSLSSRHIDKDREYCESIGESGYLSTLELHSPYDLSDTSTHVSPRERQYRFSPRGIGFSQKSMDELRSNRLNDRTPSHILSRADTLAVLNPNSWNTQHDFLISNVIQTKIITCVFEITNSGIDKLLDDISHELSRWFGGKTPLLAVATEVQWSVPVKYRSRIAETKLKELILLRLRENNRRLLYMRGGGRDLSIQLADATTHEKIAKESNIDAYQGVYRRCYRNLLPYVHSETPEWHAEYWKVDQGTTEQTLPNPEQFLFGRTRSVLINKSLVALNMAGLEIRGCTISS